MASGVCTAQGGRGRSRALRGFLACLTVAAGLGLLAPVAGDNQAPAGDRKTGPAPRVTRVTPPEAIGAVEVSVAMNPTNPDHMVAVSVARMKEHPGITDFAYVTHDAGRT
jgi:hypothetical protein